MEGFTRAGLGEVVVYYNLSGAAVEVEEDYVFSRVRACIVEDCDVIALGVYVVRHNLKSEVVVKRKGALCT